MIPAELFQGLLESFSAFQTLFSSIIKAGFLIRPYFLFCQQVWILFRFFWSLVSCLFALFCRRLQEAGMQSCYSWLSSLSKGSSRLHTQVKCRRCSSLPHSVLFWDEWRSAVLFGFFPEEGGKRRMAEGSQGRFLTCKLNVNRRMRREEA